MFGLNWIDLGIVALLIAAVFQGMRVGLLRQLLVIGGFFGALFLAGWLFPHLLPVHDRTLRTIINANLVLLFAGFVAVKGFDLSSKLKLSIGTSRFRRVESALGIFAGLTAVLVIVWLLAAMIGRLPFEGLSNSANDSLIVRTLDDHLPPIPAVFARFSRSVDPNSQPYLFTEKVAQETIPHSHLEFQTAAYKGRDSVVRITSFGCGGLASGSGFAAAPDIVITNAHVIAGVRRPIVKYDRRSYEGVPVLFDANLDLAILRTKNLPAKPLPLVSHDVALSKTVAVLGYPGGNYTEVPGVVRNRLSLFGRNIYDVGVIGRDVYELQTIVEEGSSGGPIVLPDGRAAGVIFSKSDQVAGYGYALSSSRLLGDLQRAQASHRRVSTGVCLAG